MVKRKAVVLDNQVDDENVELHTVEEASSATIQALASKQPTAASRSKEDYADEEEPAHIKPMAKTFINKQRTLIFASRGIYAVHRHLMNDLRLLLPHSKSEGKFHEKNNATKQYQLVNDVCRMKKCHNCIMFECNNQTELFMYCLKSPQGPTIKFSVTNIVTMSELRMTGNCLKGSRAVLHFDKQFDSAPHWQLSREMLAQMFATPKGHPKTKPFIDHIYCFYLVDNKIWFRHYQISLENPNQTKATKHESKRKLVEIGPRFVLQPLRILSGSMEGDILFNEDKWTPITQKKRDVALQEKKGNEIRSAKKKRRIELLQQPERVEARSVFREDSDDDEDEDDEEYNNNNNNGEAASDSDDE
jgi:ribosome biogenesis protein BRX1